MAMRTHPPRWITPALAGLTALLGALWIGLLWQHPADPALPDPLLPRSVALEGGTTSAMADWERIVAAAPFGGGTLEAAPETRLPLRLLGVIANSNSAKGQALIAEGGGNSQVYAVGASLPGGAIVLEVRPTEVILQRDGRREALRLPENLLPGTGAPSTPSTPSTPSAASTPALPSANTVEPVLASAVAATAINQIMTWQNVIRSGRPPGVRVYPGVDAARFEALGLRPGDLVVSVNQAPLGDATGSRDFAALLNSSPTLQLGIERDGRSQTLQIDVSQLNRAAAGP